MLILITQHSVAVTSSVSSMQADGLRCKTSVIHSEDWRLVRAWLETVSAPPPNCIISFI
jgi:hypothetical protein